MLEGADLSRVVLILHLCSVKTYASYLDRIMRRDRLVRLSARTPRHKGHPDGLVIPCVFCPERLRQFSNVQRRLEPVPGVLPGTPASMSHAKPMHRHRKSLWLR